ncbi:MAG TPA: tetratricopeptide repeat protein [Bacteroidota bacterium]|nr:tetratricopeptide repeat protein [Bacteroidota bacterium]
MRTNCRRVSRHVCIALAWAAACAVLTGAPGAARAQSTRSLVNGGNDLYRDQKYSDAEVNYRKALEKEKNLVQGHFNLGDALTKQGKYDEAVRQYQEALAKATGKDTKAYASYNIGNAQMKQQKYKDAVQSYVDALKIDPKDNDAKYNLSYALEKLKAPPPKPQQNKKDQDKKDQNKKDQDKQDQQKQDQQKQDQQKQQSPQQQQKQMSKADAQRILDVLKNSEKDVQKKLHQRQAVRPRTDKDW